MRNCGLGTCSECGATYTKQSSNSQTCGDDCRRERFLRRDRERYARERGIPQSGYISTKVSPMIIRVCQVCGVEFIGKRPHYPYKFCSPACCELNRDKTRKHQKKEPTEGHRLRCNVCSREFLSESRFIRTCRECKANREDHPVYSDVWGTAI